MPRWPWDLIANTGFKAAIVTSGWSPTSKIVDNVNSNVLFRTKRNKKDALKPDNGSAAKATIYNSISFSFEFEKLNFLFEPDLYCWTQYRSSYGWTTPTL